MTGTEEIVLSIIIISTISNFVVDLFGEVLLEYGVAYTRDYFASFEVSGLAVSQQASAMVDGVTVAEMVERLSSNPALVDKLSVEQLQSIISFLTSAAGAG